MPQAFSFLVSNARLYLITQGFWSSYKKLALYQSLLRTRENIRGGGGGGKFVRGKPGYEAIKKLSLCECIFGLQQFL